MHGRAGSILLVLLALFQSVSLCACRAEQVVGPAASHAHGADDAEPGARGHWVCLSPQASSADFCESHVDAKPLTRDMSSLAAAAVATSEVAPWATLSAGPPRVAAADVPEMGCGPRECRSLPLLI